MLMVTRLDIDFNTPVHTPDELSRHLVGGFVILPNQEIAFAELMETATPVEKLLIKNNLVGKL
jgi:hypothetical protein